MTTHSRARVAAALLLALAALVPACSRNRSADNDADDAKGDNVAGPPAVPKGNFVPDGGTQPQPGPAPKKNAPASRWAATAIPLNHDTEVTFGPPGCPVMVVGQDVYDTKTYKPVRKLADAYERHALRALSPNGKLFAVASKSANQTDTDVGVYSTETGQKVLDVPGQKDAFADVIAFYANTHLFVGGRHGRTIEVWDIAGKKSVGRLTVPDNRVDSDKVAFSPDGKYFAGIAHDKLQILEVATNNVAANVVPPGGEIGQPAKATDAIFVYAWTRGLAFSPDGKELALFSTNPSPRLVVWNVKGEMLLDQAVPMPQFVSHRNTLEWMPDGSGWLVNGHLLDRSTGRVVVSIRVPFASDILPHMLDKNRVAGVFGDDRDQLQTITLPWEKINASLKQLTAKGGDAYIKPGEAVSLQLDLAGLRGDENETRKVLGDAIVKRLARDGVGVAANRPTVLWVKLSEQAGEALPIYERQSPFDRRGADTGRKATEAKGAAVLELWSTTEKQPLWRGHLTATSSRSFREEITDATVRKSMLEHMTNQLNGMDLPYFIPKSKDVVALPAVVE